MASVVIVDKGASNALEYARQHDSGEIVELQAKQRRSISARYAAPTAALFGKIGGELAKRDSAQE